MAEAETDFCIVGGGPAGLTLALLLVRSGARVVLVERSRSLDREYRGEILQPGGMALLDQMGVLGPARERGCHEHDRFLLVDRGRVLIDANYRRLPEPFNCLLSIPQRHILEELLAACQGYDEFTLIAGNKVTDLMRNGDRVLGVMSDGLAGAQTVRAHCVVAADGRYSKVRRLAGISDGRLDIFTQDILWFKLPARGEAPREVRIFRAAGNPVIAYASVPDRIQIGWTLPHKRYHDVADKGIEYIKDQVSSAIPLYAALIRSHITDLKDLTLLDVFAGCAETWVRDGLVLIGDSAHTHSPIGAQGVNLAIQDAVALHPVLLASLQQRDASSEFLGQYESLRKKAIAKIMKIQVLQSRLMLATDGFAALARSRVASVVSRTPAYNKILRQLAFGDQAIQVPDRSRTTGVVP